MSNNNTEEEEEESKGWLLAIGISKIFMYLLISGVIITVFWMVMTDNPYVFVEGAITLLKSWPLLLIFSIVQWGRLYVADNKRNSKLPNLFYFITPIYQVLVAFYL